MFSPCLSSDKLWGDSARTFTRRLSISLANIHSDLAQSVLETRYVDHLCFAPPRANGDLRSDVTEEANNTIGLKHLVTRGAWSELRQ